MFIRVRLPLAQHSRQGVSERYADKALKFVPEQDTDFIFCTVGEEEGFLGSAGVLVLFLALILRLIHLAERQPLSSTVSTAIAC